MSERLVPSQLHKYCTLSFTCLRCRCNEERVPSVGDKLGLQGGGRLGFPVSTGRGNRTNFPFSPAPLAVLSPLTRETRGTCECPGAPRCAVLPNPETARAPGPCPGGYSRQYGRRGPPRPAASRPARPGLCGHVPARPGAVAMLPAGRGRAELLARPCRAARPAMRPC